MDLVGEALRVVCSPVERILVTGGAPGCQLATGDGLTEATIPLGFLAGATHLRVTVSTAAGQRAWTNPLWRESADLTSPRPSAHH